MNGTFLSKTLAISVHTIVGRTGIFRKFSEEDIVFASYLVRINPDPEIITPEYLTAFLNTKYGVLDVKRRTRISINQSNVNPEELKRVEIPLLCHELQTKITLSFDKAFHLIQASEAKYHQAQTLLLSELGLADWQPKPRLTFVKNYSNAQRTERIDAEYFQPKYEEIVHAIKSYNEYLTLVLNSILTKEQVNRDVGGSVILHWRPDQVQGTVIPILPTEKQDQIQQKVTESFNLRKQSKHLLECAKRSVEMAIEQDEQTAIDWLEDETKSLLH